MRDCRKLTLLHSFRRRRDVALLAFCASQRFSVEPGGRDQRLSRKLQQPRAPLQMVEAPAARGRTRVARFQTLMHTLNDLRAAVIGGRSAAMPFPFLLIFALACEAFRERVLVTGRFLPTVV